MSRHPRRHSLPPKDYKDLTHTDIRLLAPLFRPAPLSGTSASAVHEASIRHKIQDLPLHLRCKLPKLSTFCSLHEKLNPLPILSILEAVQHEVSSANLDLYEEAVCGQTIRFLKDVNGIWLKPAEFRARYGVPAPYDFAYVPRRCAACRLAMVAMDTHVLTTLGGLVIASIDPANWKKSKRIYWFEEWLKTTVEEEERLEGAILSMFDFAIELIERRPRRKKSMGRAHVEEFMARAQGIRGSEMPTTLAGSAAKEMRTPPARPSRETIQEGHVEFAKATLQFTRLGLRNDPFGDEEEAKTPSPREMNTPRAPRKCASSVYSRDNQDAAGSSRGRKEPSQPSRDSKNTFSTPLSAESKTAQSPQDTAEHHSTQNLPRMASSIYSRPEHGDERSSSWRGEVEGRVISSYRRTQHYI